MRSASKTGLRKSGGRDHRKANTEIEIKLRVRDRRRVLRQLARLAAKRIGVRVHEMNTLYDTADGNLARHGQMLRLRMERAAPRAGSVRRAGKMTRKKPEISALLTFKGPANGARARAGRYKVREEHELRVAESGEMPKILEALGLRPWFRYEKFRSTFGLPKVSGLKLALDETPIGIFLELEGARQAIDRAAKVLGFSPADYIVKSYGALFMEERGLARPESHNEPIPSLGLPNMLFRARARS